MEKKATGSESVRGAQTVLAIAILGASAACLQATPWMEGADGPDPRSDDLERGSDRGDSDLGADQTVVVGVLAVADEADVAEDDQPVAHRWTPADVLAARAVASWCAQMIVDGEVGGGVTRNGVRYEPYDPYSPGALGERGPVQLLPVRGLLPDFYRQGYTEPENPYEAIPYMDDAVSRRGLGRHWSTAPRGCR